jgi:hypothetical protein
MDIPADWISEASVIAATGTSHRNLLNWRHNGLLPEAKVRHLGRGMGTETFCPPVTIPMVRRINELRGRERNKEAWRWALWLDPADYPIDIVAWCKNRLGEPKAAAIAQIELKALQSTVTRKPGRSDPRRAIFRLLNTTLWYALMKWAAAVAARREPIPSLYDPHSPALEALGKAGNLSIAAPLGKTPLDLLPEPGSEFSIEEFSPKDVLASATDGEIERAREDWRSLARIAELLEMGESICLGGNQQAIRARYSANPPPLIAWPLAAWRDFGARAILLPGLIAVRRMPGNQLSDFLPGIEGEIAKSLRQAGHGVP